MASTFAKTAPITRDHFIEGYGVRIVIDGNGITFQRKGDRSREKATITVPWTAVAEIGAERDPVCEGRDFYSYLRLDELGMKEGEASEVPAEEEPAA